MTRPTYENASDRSAETVAVQKFIKSFGGEVDFIKLPMQYKMDFALTRNGVRTALVEVKCRRNKKHAYPTYMISMSKLVAAAGYRSIGINCILLVQWADGMGWVQMSNEGWSVRVGGRKDRNDWQDIEPVTHIPISEFKDVIKVEDAK